MASITIRDSRAGDAGAIQAVYAHYVEHTAVSFEEQVPDVAEVARRREALIAAGYPYLVAEQAGALVGYAYASAYRPRSAYRYTVEDSVYLHPERVGQGIGAALLDALISRTSALGFRRMVAVIGDRSDASIALHARMGFRLVGHLEGVGFKFGRFYDTTVMERALGTDA